MSDKPNPGSAEAVAQGCKCPLINNHYGDGVPIEGEPQFRINSECPIHGEEANEKN